MSNKILELINAKPLLPNKSQASNEEAPCFICGNKQVTGNWKYNKCINIASFTATHKVAEPGSNIICSSCALFLKKEGWIQFCNLFV